MCLSVRQLANLLPAKWAQSWSHLRSIRCSVLANSTCQNGYGMTRPQSTKALANLFNVSQWARLPPSNYKLQVTCKAKQFQYTALSDSWSTSHILSDTDVERNFINGLSRHVCRDHGSKRQLWVFRGCQNIQHISHANSPNSCTALVAFPWREWSMVKFIILPKHCFITVLSSQKKHQ